MVFAIDSQAGERSALGGQTTRALTGKKAFTFPVANLREANQRAFFFGNRLFNTNWVVAPASVQSFDGLGPLYNRISCSGCHTQDGRGRPPLLAAEPMESMLLRIGLARSATTREGAPHPVYGNQISDRALQGVAPEGTVRVVWKTVYGNYGDGMPYELQKPEFSIESPGYGPFGELLISPRVAPQIIGLGLLEAVPEAAIMVTADPGDINGDGISGRPNFAPDPKTGTFMLGRFGWKANQPHLEAQNASAALGDIGLTNPVLPSENCSGSQVECAASRTGGGIDLTQSYLDRLTLYTRLLAVPAQRDGDSPQVAEGEALFASMGCQSCHTPDMITGADALLPELANQKFHPYTDLLLHDMGPGLADGLPDHDASGTEWKTPPLWGIGLFPSTNGHDRLLHDGRARGPAEAVLWHGGEAQKAREAFRNASKAERDALVSFLNSL